MSKQNSRSSEPRDSSEAMIMEAKRQGWLQELKFIPELIPIYHNAADYFLGEIEKCEPRMRETLVFDCSRYLFAKAVEGVILWGSSLDGKISVFFHPDYYFL